MLEQLKYVNHLNEVFEFGQNGVYVNENELHNFEWTVNQKGGRISSLSHAVRNRKLPVVIICETEAEGIAARNRLMEITEKDVLAFQPGRLVVGDYYYRCYITKSQKKEYLKGKRYMTATLTVTTDTPVWVKETVFSYPVGTIQTYSFLDYAHDYPHDYLPSVTIDTLNNPGFAPSDFRLIIYGQCQSPEVYVGDHCYSVSCAVNAGEYLTIDSKAKTITLTGVDGSVTNKFSRRSMTSYIFEKIPAGVNTVSRDNPFGFDIILLEERSEPKWI